MAAPVDDKGKENGFLDQCAMYFVRSDRLSESMIKALKDTVQKYDAQVIETEDDGSIPVPSCTHIIAETIDFPQYDEAMAMMVPVVRPAWINASLRRGRQAQIRPYSPDPRLFFSNVVLACDELPVTDKESIIGAVLALGGTQSKDVGRLTTHICALSTDGPKARMAKERRWACKIVLPHWFDDCFRLGKRIDEGPYLLPDPEILRANPDDAVEIPENRHLEGATSARPDRPPHRPANARQKLTVFENKKVALSWDLQLSDGLRSTLQDLITNGGGDVVDSTQDCDWFVCQYRDGPEYIRAAQHGKDVGSLAWLYHVIFRNQWSNPLHRLLHYPVPRGGMDGFKGLRITISNYGGEARTYLMNLLSAAGADVTGAMRQDNTHLITARKAGDKCDAAGDWNIPMVNHLWVEESYAKCEVQALTDPRYSQFPPRTNLSEVIGQTWFDESRLHAVYYPGGDDDLDTAARRKRTVKNMVQNNARRHGPGAGLVVGRQKHPEFDILKDDEVEYADKTACKFGVPAPPKANAQPDSTTPVRAQHLRTGKENDTSSVYSSGSRSAKASALSKLQNMAPDIALYEKERKRKSTGNTPFGGKRAADRIEQEREKEREKKAQEKGRSKSPSHERADEEGEDEDDAEEQRPAKRQKSSLPPVDMRIVLTGYKRWTDNAKKEDADRRKLRAMGIQIVQESAQCDYLAAPQLLRTVKFVRTLAQGPEVISSTFIDDCLDQGERQRVERYKLKDKEREKSLGVNLEKSIRRARQNKGQLMWGVPIYCTASIKSGPESYRPIAEANGAIFKTYNGRTSTIKVTPPEEDSQGPEPVYLLTTNSKAEQNLWPRFEKMARDGNMLPRIVCVDWLLWVAMNQELAFHEKYLAENFYKGKP
ncbi:hypothetical protein M406DRAFT_294946 [Cryphonectria parasitica EP155]|uniref:BRCT domain-containing protein n=1 Tax=Cryphonectria parasitica (strain ATCC 38755 / EP155) TaxID=660469 RepID=A0A9P4XUY6_CRYP1|nr:uncharacterized protein M406DRAFT_294946 [Cryphonectria parasitica EP155]KAF3761378.1 hypothetical protein M406DRAFT_294946 [Cryphonectria parasitica EP155]